FAGTATPAPVCPRGVRAAAWPSVRTEKRSSSHGEETFPLPRVRRHSLPRWGTGRLLPRQALPLGTQAHVTRGDEEGSTRPHPAGHAFAIPPRPHALDLQGCRPLPVSHPGAMGTRVHARPAR